MDSTQGALPGQASPANGTNVSVDNLFPARGRQTFFVVVEDRRIVEIREAEIMDTRQHPTADGPISTPSVPASDWLPMRKAAHYLDKSYTWLSRNWKQMSLKPSVLGGAYSFHRKDLDALREQHRRTPRGRRRKVVRVIDG